MKEEKFNRQQLYDLVWSQSMLSIYKKYCISIKRLQRICKSMNIPIPPFGCWQRVESGLKSRVISLPETDKVYKDITLPVRDENSTESAVKIVKRITEELKADEKLMAMDPNILVKPDKMIRETKAYLKKNTKKIYTDWNRYSNYSANTLNIKISSNIIDRSLRIMDTFIKMLRYRGHDIITKYGNTYALVFGEEIEICLREKNKLVIIKTDNIFDKREFHPTGLLIFQISKHPEKSYIDGKETLLEDKLINILAYLEHLAKKKIKQRAYQEEQRRIIEEEERIARELQERKDKEKTNFINLIKQANHYHQAMILRDYIAAYENNAINKNQMTPELKNWINWAKKKIDWFDPFVKREDELLTETDRFNIDDK